MFNPTEKQIEAINLISNYKRVLLYGGARSGKSVIIIRAIIIRAAKEKSRHVCFREMFNHVKTSLWHDSFPNVLSMWFPDLKVKFNNSDFFIELSNGSQIWFGGLDDKERTDKILGTEYSTIFFNEISQISYSSITTALTRLSENTELTKRAFFDCNPPSMFHWSYKLFIQKIDPDSKLERPIQNLEMYAAMQINPYSNAVNLPAGYIEETLMGLSERAKERFLHGNFTLGQTGGEYYPSFEYDSHVDMPYNPSLPIHLSFDFNYVPYNPAGLFQIHKLQDLKKGIIWSVHMIDEFALTSPHNSTEHVCEAILARYGNHKSGWLIYGDATGKAGTITNKEQRSNWDTVYFKFRGRISDYSIKVPRANPSNAMRRDSIGRIMEQKPPIRLLIGEHCKYMIADLMYCKEDVDGGKDKRATKDENGQSSQKYGHMGDLLEYLICSAFEKFFLIVK